MKLFSPNKLRGSWQYESNKYGYGYDNVPYPEFRCDLKILLTELTTSQILIPRKLEGVDGELIYSDIDEIANKIFNDKYLKDCFEFNITGDTVIYTKRGEEVYSGIFTIESFRTFQQSFILSTYSDIWLPMAFDEDSFSYIWNLERHNLNYKRLPNVLKKITSGLSWENENLLTSEFHERGSMQAGYDLYLSSEVLNNEYKRNPNNNFDLNNYLLKINRNFR